MQVIDSDFLHHSLASVWNQKMLGSVREIYANNALIHIAGRTLHGGEELSSEATAWLAAFPDLRVYLDDIIQLQREGQTYVSARWTAVGHNLGPTRFGPPAGRRVVIRGITTGIISGGRFREQWIEYGDLHLVRQLGIDEQTALDALRGEEPAGAFENALLTGPAQTSDVRTAPVPEPSTPGELIEAAVQSIWNNRQIGEVSRYYSAAYREYGPGDDAVYGATELQGRVLSLLGAFPDLQVYIDDAFWTSENGLCRSSARWTLLGTNSGPSTWGPGPGAYLRLSGITNHRIEEGQFVEGWTACSQLNLARSLAPAPPVPPFEESGDRSPNNG